MRFANVFRDIAESIANARNHRNVINPRLMLQQAFLLREWVQHQSQSERRPEDAPEILMQAQFVLEEALDMLSDSGQHHRLRTYVATELASTLGTITQDSIRTKEKSRDEVERDFQRVLDAVANARRLDPTTYNPVDILAWSTLEVARSGVVDNFTSTEAMVDVLDALAPIHRKDECRGVLKG